MTGWLLVLVLFLWVTGGAGWINSYEAMEETEFKFFGRATVMAGADARDGGGSGGPDRCGAL